MYEIIGTLLHRVVDSFREAYELTLYQPDAIVYSAGRIVTALTDVEFVVESYDVNTDEFICCEVYYDKNSAQHALVHPGINMKTVLYTVPRY